MRLQRYRKLTDGHNGLRRRGAGRQYELRSHPSDISERKGFKTNSARKFADRVDIVKTDDRITGQASQSEDAFKEAPVQLRGIRPDTSSSFSNPLLWAVVSGSINKSGERAIF